MDLWIRSQDKHNLVKVNNLSASYDFDYNDNKHCYTIQEHEYGTALGYYETKERALEVLDKVQKHLMELGKTYANTDNRGIINGLTYYGHVFEMPEE